MGIKKQPLILTIDDEFSIRASFRNFLEDYDYEVLEAENGRIGIEVFEERKPDLVLVDMRMPEMDGLGVLDAITKKSPETPVIVVSGTGVIGDVVEALHKGAWDYMLKPVEDMSVLHHAIKKSLERARLLRENHLYQEHLEEEVAKRTLELEKAKDALQRANEELEGRVQTRTAELVKAKEIADTAAKAKSIFLANMSHEIRTPMNGVIAATDLALNESLSPKVEHFLKIIHSSGYTLLGIINDILDFSKIEAGKLTVDAQPLRLDAVLEQAVALSMNKVNEKEIELLVDMAPEIPMALEGDVLRIQQVLINLLSNAVKFTERSGSIFIGVADSGKHRDSGMIELDFFIRDTGVGMSPEQQQRLFQPFTQADTSTTRKYGGTGLGLSICKKLTEMMGGGIRVESEEGKGTTFTFTLCLKRQAPEQSTMIEIPEKLKGLNILVVDDHADSGMLLGQILKSYDSHVELLSSGPEALSRIEKNFTAGSAFDLIFLDDRMHELNGFEVARRIRTHLRSDIPVIIMPALGKEIEIHDGGDVSGVLTKPFYPSSVLTALKAALDEERPVVKKTQQANATIVSVYRKLFRGMHVLLVEDNKTNQIIARIILQNVGVVVKIAKNGREAVQAVQNYDFDAVLMDIQMPEMDGLEATRIIRNELNYRDLPIIAMTAHAFKADEKKCFQAGMDGYVAKPIKQGRLFEVLYEKIRYRPDLKGDVRDTSLGNIEVQEPDFPMDLPGIAVQDALNDLNISKDAYKNILLGFLKFNKDCISKVRGPFSDKNWKLLKDFAHEMKGSASNIRAAKLHDTARDLESACMDAEAEQREYGLNRELIDNLEYALNQVLASIQMLIDKP